MAMPQPWPLLSARSKGLRYSILYPKLFGPTVKKNLLVIGRTFQITKTIYSNSERSEQFLK